MTRAGGRAGARGIRTASPFEARTWRTSRYFLREDEPGRGGLDPEELLLDRREVDVPSRDDVPARLVGAVVRFGLLVEARRAGEGADDRRAASRARMLLPRLVEAELGGEADLGADRGDVEDVGERTPPRPRGLPAFFGTSASSRRRTRRARRSPGAEEAAEAGAPPISVSSMSVTRRCAASARWARGAAFRAACRRRRALRSRRRSRSHSAR